MRRGTRRITVRRHLTVAFGLEVINELMSVRKLGHVGRRTGLRSAIAASGQSQKQHAQPRQSALAPAQPPRSWNSLLP